MDQSSDFAGDVPHGVRQWLKAAREGSNKHLGRLLEANRAYLLKIANERLPTDLRAKGGASDLVQQSFLRAQQGFKNFQGDCEQELKAWLRKILLNHLANFNRDYRRAEKRYVGRESPLEMDSSRQHVADLRDAWPSPSSIVARQEDNEQLASAMHRLPDDYRRVLVLRYWKRLSFGEIGRLMDRTPNAVRKVWLRAIDRLHAELEDRSADSM